MSPTRNALRAACTAQITLETPLGPLLLACSTEGLVGAWFEGQKDHPGTLEVPVRPDNPLLAETARQLRLYFAGQLQHFDLQLDLRGTPFQCAVWRALLEIEPGATRSYHDVAVAVGRPTALRAVGAAVGLNPISVIVPCHRVIGSNGTLTGYAGGLDRKVALLRLEHRDEPEEESRGNGADESANDSVKAWSAARTKTRTRTPMLRG